MGRAIVAGGAEATKPSKKIQLSTIADGSIVKLNENGSPVEFYVAKHDYESTLNGTGRTLLVRKDCYDKRAFGSSKSTFAGSTMCSFLNGTYKGLLDADVQIAIGSTTFYYTYPYDTVTTGSKSVFLLSIAELGLTSSYAMVEGSKLPTSDLLKIAYFNGTAVEQYTRTVYHDDYSYVFYVGANGTASNQSYSVLRYSRPCFTLPATACFDEKTMLFKGVA